MGMHEGVKTDVEEFCDSWSAGFFF